jgi:hypothetical protein
MDSRKKDIIMAHFVQRKRETHLQLENSRQHQPLQAHGSYRPGLIVQPTPALSNRSEFQLQWYEQFIIRRLSICITVPVSSGSAPALRRAFAILTLPFSAATISAENSPAHDGFFVYKGIIVHSEFHST